MDWHRVHAILNMVQDSEVIDSLQTTEERDVLHCSDHDSSSESELQDHLDDSFLDSKMGYVCKNREIISKTPQVISPSVNPKEHLKSRKLRAFEPKYIQNIETAWQQYFSDDLLEQIVTSTNDHLGQNEISFTDIREIKTLIGVLYLHGIYRPTHQKCSDLWDDVCGVPCIRSAITYDRFKFLLENMRFEKNCAKSNVPLDPMRRIRKVFEIFALNCRTSFDVKNTAVIDEIIVPVYGPCPFRYEIDKKSLKRGIKMVLLVDPNNFYVTNLDVISDPYFGAEEVVKKMVQHLVNTERTIVMDSWFTSFTLMEILKNEYQLFTVAALKTSHHHIPPAFLSPYRKCKSVMTGFLQDSTCITSYVTSESKCVNVISNDPRYYHKGRHIGNSTVVSFYKKNQSAVEVLDVLMHYYTTMQMTNDWTLSLFFTMLNIATINTQVLWSSENINKITHRRNFIKDLALSLLRTDKLLVEIDDIPINNLVQNSSYFMNRRRCRICIKTMKRDRKTKQCCVKCGQSTCKEHCVNVCVQCLG